MQREVRQRCRFGCVMCGCPVYDIEHIVEYSKTGVHEVDNLALLCPSHHADKTRGRLPAERVRAALEGVLATGKRPEEGTAELYYGPQVTVKIGSNDIKVNLTESRPTVNALSIDDTVMLGFRLEDGKPLIAARILDPDNKSVMRIRNSQLSYTEEMWDITYIGTVLTMRRGLGDIYLEIDFEPPVIDIRRAMIFGHGVGLRINKDELTVINKECGVSGSTFNGVGIGFGNPTDSSLGISQPLQFMDIPRFRYKLPPPAFGYSIPSDPDN